MVEELSVVTTYAYPLYFIMKHFQLAIPGDDQQETSELACPLDTQES